MATIELLLKYSAEPKALNDEGRTTCRTGLVPTERGLK
jgi:hypothetical protein